ncbi:hypothetical protein [uncultured Anaerococcus sp.]|uniref:hypothetical protein n=1 Tax=uncultured Anaerococcus sp. TaxID=293428 RepID=UPI00288B6D53|nr:hypothetical protein [uncultured Anaerococcus sp.]
MKIYLKDQNKRKISYDILNIFLDHEDIDFSDDKNGAEIKIEDESVNISGKDFAFKTNQDLKIILYEYLTEKTGYKSPWGTLTGSKPSKLLKNKTLEEIKNTYKLSDEKLMLLAKVKENQDRLNISPEDFSLYINIPFCPTRCDYCSYPT